MKHKEEGGHVKKIRIVLANRPRLMREVVRKIIEQEGDMEIVGEVLDPLDLLVAVRETKADAVIVALNNSEAPGVCSHLLGVYPDLTILGVAPQGNSAFIEQLCPRRREIINPSDESILRALRQAIQSPCRADEGLKK